MRPNRGVRLLCHGLICWALLLGALCRAGLVARWGFDIEDPWIVAESVGRNLGIRSILGTRYDADGVSGKALYFNGADRGRVRVGTRLTLVDKPFTWVMWVRLKPGENQDLVVFLSLHEPGLGGGYYVGFDPVGRRLKAYAGAMAETAFPVMLDDGRWHQVAVTYVPGVELQIYWNGAGPVASALLPKPLGSDAGLVFGGWDVQEGWGGFTGWLDEVQLYDEALSQRDLRLLHEFPGRSLAESLAQTVRIDPPGGAFTNHVVVTLTTLAEPTEIRYTLDGSEPGAGATSYRGPLRITNSVTVKARAFDSNGVPRTRIDTARFEIGRDRYPASRLLAHWTFDQVGDQVAHDAGGRYPGILSRGGAAMVTNGVAGGALRLDSGSGGLVNMGNVLPLTETDFTIALWVRVSTNRPLATAYLVSKGWAYWFVLATLGNYLQANIEYWNGHQAPFAKGDNAWHHVAFTHVHRGESRIYLDGEAKAIMRNLGDVPAVDEPFLVGSDGKPTAGGDFDGWLDDLQVYDMALLAHDVEDLVGHPGKALTEPRVDLAMIPDGGAFLDAVRVRMETPVLGGTIRYTLDGRVPTTNSTAYAGSLFLLESAELKARVFVGENAVSETHVRRFEVVAEPVATRRLLGRWRFDETVERVASDETGWFPAQLMGVSTNGARFVEGGVSGNAVLLQSGFGGMIHLGDALPLTNSAFSVSVWLRSNERSVNGGAVLLGHFEPDRPSDLEFAVKVFAASWPVMITSGGWLRQFNTRRIADIADGQWHHLVMTRGMEGLLRVFLDGEAVSGPVSLPAIVATNRSMGIGGTDVKYRPPNFNGSIDELQAYDFELSDGQVTRLFARPGERLAVGMDPPPRPPTFTEAPKAVTVEGGETATFSVAAEGTLPLAFQWYRDGTALTGATNATLSLPKVSVVQAGTYQVRVTNRRGTVASDEVPLKVVVPPPGPAASLIAHWRCEDGGFRLIEETGWYPGVIENQDLPFIPGGIAGGALAMDRTEGGFVGIDSSFALPEGAFTISLWYRYPFTPPTRDVVFFSNRDSATGAGILLGLEVPSGRWFALSGSSAKVSQVGTNALDRRWHHVLLSRASNGDLRLHVDGAPPSVGIGSLVPPPVTTRTFLGATDGPGPTQGGAAPAFDGAIDEVQVYDFAVPDEMVGRLIDQPGVALPAAVRRPPVRPAILELSKDLVVEEGGRALLRVVATGTGPLAYQWYFKDAPIPGAERPEYEIAMMTRANAGEYRVHVFNVAGMERSNPIRVQVPDPTQVAPEFLLTPVGRTVPLGNPMAFSAVVIGTPPLGYQWYHDGIPIFGADQATYLIPRVDDLRFAGNYHLVVTNLAGSIRSPTVQLGIQGIPSIRFLGPDRVREGGVAHVEMRFSTGGGVKVKDFFFQYPSGLLGPPRFRWTDIVDEEIAIARPSFERGSHVWNFWVVGRGSGLPPGDQLIATFEFPVLAPFGEETAHIGFMPLDPLLDPYPAGSGWAAFPSEIDVLPRRMKGDENGNLRLDVADLASILERLRTPAQITPGLAFANDLDGSGRLELADAARALRILTRRDPAPALAPAFPGERGPSPPESREALASLTLEPAVAPANRVRATVRLGAGTRPPWGASFTMHFDPSVFRIRALSDLSAGAAIPSDALVTWYQPTNETSVAHFAAGSGAPWTASSDVLATVDFEVLPEVASGRSATVRLEAFEVARGLRELPESSLPVTAVFNAPPERPPTLTVGRSGNGAIWLFEIEGLPGRSYGIEVSTNLIEWQGLPAVVTGADGRQVFRQGPETGITRAFYRARSAP